MKHLLCLLLALLLLSWAAANAPQYDVAESSEPVVSFTVGLPVPGVSSPEKSDDKINQRLATAMQLTAKGDDEAALSILGEVAQVDPVQGIPALGRFLFLKQRETELAAFRKELANPEKSIDPVAAARGWNAIGETDKAIELLRKQPEILNGDRIDGTILLANLLRKEGKHGERTDLLLEAIRSSKSSKSRVLIVNELLRNHPVELLDRPDDLIDLVSVGFHASKPSRERAIAVMDPLILELQQRPGYFEKRQKFLDAGQAKDAASAWFATRLIVREENPFEALQYANSVEERLEGDELWTLFAGEKAELLWMIGKHDEARQLFEKLANDTKGSESAVYTFKKAQSIMARNDFSEALALMEQIDGADLPEEFQSPYWMLYMTAAAEGGDLSKIVVVYIEVSGEIRREEYGIIHRIIFERVLATEDHIALEQLIRERFEDEEDTPPELWLLASEAAANARKTPNQLEALYQYTRARPRDLQAVELLASVSTPLAIELSSVSAGDIAAPAGEIERITHLSESALLTLVKARPFDPAPMTSLMELYEALGDEEKAVSVPMELAMQSGDNSVLGTVAYMLALTGHPEEALRLYDEGLVREPDNMQLMMNRAACLTRLDRTGEAKEFYRDLLQHGHNGRTWHFHELLDRLWKIAEQEEDTEGYIEWLENIIPTLSADRQFEAYEDASAMLVHQGYFDSAEPLLQKLVEISQASEEKEAAYEKYLNACFKAQRLSRAAEVAREALEVTESPEGRIELEQVLAEIAYRQGEREEAVSSLKAIAESYPDTQTALFGLYRAAEMLEESREVQKSRTFYQRFLDSGSTQFYYRNLAKERLASFGKDGS